MSRYYCNECQNHKDRDYDGYNAVSDTEGVCDDCAQGLEERYIAEITERYMASVGLEEALQIVRADMERRLGRQDLEWLTEQHKLLIGGE